MPTQKCSRLQLQRLFLILIIKLAIPTIQLNLFNLLLPILSILRYKSTNRHFCERNIFGWLSVSDRLVKLVNVSNVQLNERVSIGHSNRRKTLTTMKEGKTNNLICLIDWNLLPVHCKKHLFNIHGIHTFNVTVDVQNTDIRKPDLSIIRTCP